MRAAWRGVGVSVEEWRGAEEYQRDTEGKWRAEASE